MDSSLFPLSFQSHIIFCAISVIFFAIQFIRMRCKYQIIAPLAILSTLLVYVSEEKVFFYSVGVLELILLIVLMTVMNKEKKALEAAANAADDSELKGTNLLGTDGENKNEDSNS